MENNLIFFEITRDILLIIASIIGSIVALIGLRAWRKQLRGKSEYELAIRILKDIYKLRSAVNAVRCPLILDIEMYSALKEENKDAVLTNDNWNIALVYKMRWNDVRDALADLYIAEIEAEVHWDENIQKAFKELHHLLTKLRIDLEEYLKLCRMKEVPEHLLSLQEKLRKRVNEQGDCDNPDEFTIELQNKITLIEKLVKVYLK